MVHLWVVTLACLLSRALGCDPGDFSVRSPSDFPLASPSDSIEVFFMRAELLKSSLHTTAMTVINGFHSGVGFRSANGTTWQFEYDADEFTGAIVPAVEHERVQWKNEAEVCGRSEISASYWTVATTLATITGEQYNQLNHTIGRWYQANSLYQLFALVDTENGQAFQQATTCTDFTFGVLDAIQSLGVTLRPAIPTVTSQFSLFPNKTIPVERVKADLWHPVTLLEVAAFYRRLYAVTQDFKNTTSWFHRIRDVLLEGLEWEQHVFFVLDVSDPSRKTYFKTYLNRTRPMDLQLLGPVDPKDTYGMLKQDDHEYAYPYR